MLSNEIKDDGMFKPYLRSTNVQWLKPDVRDVKTMWFSLKEMNDLRIAEGDLLVSEGGEVGRTCIWANELEECYIQNSVHRVIAGSEILPRFLLMQFFVSGKRGRFDSIVNKVSIAHLTREKLVDVFFSVPPIDEQERILRFIDTELEPIEQAITRTQKELALIGEYRERLIADVITGQIDVRNWRPGPDDEIDEADLSALSEGDEAADEEDADEND